MDNKLRMLDSWFHITWSWLTSDHVAIIAMAVSVIGLTFSWWSTRVARRSAAAAEAQAQAAVDQVTAAREQIYKSQELTEVEALQATREAIAQSTPKVVLTLNPVDLKPRIYDFRNEEIPTPFIVESTDTNDMDHQLDFAEYRFQDIYYVLQGALYNDGDRTALITPHDGQVFYEGVNPVTGEDTRFPHKSASEHAYLLFPRQWALLQVVARAMIDDLVTDESKGKPFYTCDWNITPGDSSDPAVRLRVTVRAEPLYWSPKRADFDAITFRASERFIDISTTREVYTPKSLEYLRAYLRDDYEGMRRAQEQDYKRQRGGYF